MCEQFEDLLLYKSPLSNLFHLLGSWGTPDKHQAHITSYQTPDIVHSNFCFLSEPGQDERNLHLQHQVTKNSYICTNNQSKAIALKETTISETIPSELVKTEVKTRVSSESKVNNIVESPLNTQLSHIKPGVK